MKKKFNYFKSVKGPLKWVIVFEAVMFLVGVISPGMGLGGFLIIELGGLALICYYSGKEIVKRYNATRSELMGVGGVLWLVYLGIGIFQLWLQLHILPLNQIIFHFLGGILFKLFFIVVILLIGGGVAGFAPKGSKIPDFRSRFLIKGAESGICSTSPPLRSEIIFFRIYYQGGGER